MPQPENAIHELRREILQYGVHLLMQETDKEITHNRIIWRLFQEAAHVDRSIQRPRPQGIRSGQPQPIVTDAEIAEIERERAIENIIIPKHETSVPSAKAIMYYDEIMVWLRFIRSNNIPRAQRGFIFLAYGMSQRKVQALLGYESKRAVEVMRRYALECISKKLKPQLAEITYET